MQRNEGIQFIKTGLKQGPNWIKMKNWFTLFLLPKLVEKK